MRRLLFVGEALRGRAGVGWPAGLPVSKPQALVGRGLISGGSTNGHGFHGGFARGDAVALLAASGDASIVAKWRYGRAPSGT